MKTDKDFTLVERVQNEHCESSLIELINRHKPLCYSIYKRFSPLFESSGIQVQDVSDEMPGLVFHSAITYNPQKNVKFVTWLGNTIRFQCLNALNNRELKNVPTEQETLINIIDQKSLENQKRDSSTIDYVFDILEQLKDERVKEVFRIRYFEGPKKTPWAEVAKKMKISVQTAINIHARGIKILKEKLKSEEMFDLV